MGKLVVCKDCGQLCLHHGRGLCRTCYSRWWIKQHPERIRQLREKYAQRYGERERLTSKLCHERNKRENIEYLKSLGPIKCAICGYDKCFEALEFHHMDPSQKKNYRDEMGYWLKYCPSTFRDKIKSTKLQILCANCHRELNAEKHNKVEIK